MMRDHFPGIDPRQLESGALVPAPAGIVSPRPSLDTILVVTGWSSIDSGDLASPTEVSFQFPWSGVITEVICGAEDVASQAQALVSLEMRISMPQTHQEIAASEAGAGTFAKLAAYYDGQGMPVPFLRYVEAKDRITIAIRNLSATAYKPFVNFRFSRAS